MAIERLHLPEGVPVWGLTDPYRVVDRLLEERAEELTVLAAGNYDLTPVIGPARGKQSDWLTVLDDGTGMMRFRPAEETRTDLYNWRQPGSFEQKHSGQGTVVHLPGDRKRLCTITEHHLPSKRGMALIVEVVRWREDIGILGTAALAEHVAKELETVG